MVKALGALKAALICGGDGDVDGLCRFVIKGDAVFEAQLIADNLKAIIRDGVGEAVAIVRVNGGDRANDCAGVVLIDSGVGERDARRAFIYIIDIDGEGLAALKAALVCGGDGDVDGLRRFVIKGDAVFEAELIADNLEAIIRDGVGEAVAIVRVNGGDRANDCAGVVLIDSGVGERDARRAFVDIINIDGEALGALKAALICGGDGDVDGLRRFVIKGDAVFEAELIADNLEAIIRDGVGEAVAIVRVNGRDRANDCAGVVLIDSGVGERDARRAFVDIIDIDGEGLAALKAALICGGDGDVDGLRRFVIKGDAVFEAELIADNLEAIIRDGVGEAVAIVRVDRRDRANDCAGVVLIDSGVGERDARRAFVDIIDIDGEGLGTLKAALICGGDGDVDGLRRFVIKGDAVFEAELIADNLEAIIRDGVGEAVAIVRVDRRDRANDCAGVVLIDSGVGERDARRAFVDIINIDGEGLAALKAALICGGDGDVDGLRRFVIKGDAVFEAELIADNLEAIIRDGVGEAVAIVRVNGRDRANDCAGVVLIDSGVGERDARRAFVDIINIDGEGLAALKAALICGGDGDVDGLRRFVIKGDAVFEAELIADNLEAIIRDGVGEAVAIVRVDRRDRANDCAGVVLIDSGVGERDARRAFVDIINIDGEALGALKAALICGGDGDVDGLRRFVIKGDAVFEAELIADNLKRSSETV